MIERQKRNGGLLPTGGSMAEVQFTFICEKKFDDLEGESSLVGYCDGCQRRVLNLDLLDEDQQQTVLATAASTEEKSKVQNEPLIDDSDMRGRDDSSSCLL